MQEGRTMLQLILGTGAADKEATTAGFVWTGRRDAQNEFSGKLALIMVFTSMTIWMSSFFLMYEVNTVEGRVSNAIDIKVNPSEPRRNYFFMVSWQQTKILMQIWLRWFLVLFTLLCSPSAAFFAIFLYFVPNESTVSGLLPNENDRETRETAIALQSRGKAITHLHRRLFFSIKFCSFYK